MNKKQRRQCIDACRILAASAGWQVDTRGKKWTLNHGSELCPSELDPTQVLGALLAQHLTEKHFGGLGMNPEQVRVLIGEKNIFHTMPRVMAGHHESLWLTRIAPELRG